MLTRPAPPFRDQIVAAMPKLRNFAISLCRNVDKADDLVQDTVLRAIAKEHQFQVGSNLDAWLFTILKFKFLTDRRKAKREVEDPDETMAKSVPLEDSPLKKMEAREALQLVEQMPAQWRTPLRLIADGATYEEVAAELTEQIGTIKSRVNRGRAMLKAAE
jgi:RNA polymerase sigma-70 factor (ECF subfamily)